MKNKEVKIFLEQAENMLNKPLLATNKYLFEKIVGSNLVLRKKPTMYDALVALLKELFPKQEREISIPVIAMGIIFAWFFMWSYTANTSLFNIPAVVESVTTSVVGVNPKKK